MSSVSRFHALSTGDKFRLFVAVLLLATVRLCLSLLSFSQFREALLRIASAGSVLVPGTATADRIAWAVTAADRRLPGSRTCLMRSLTGETILCLYGHTPQHRIGVDRTADGTIEAHSWIECEGRILIGDLEDIARYDTLPPLDEEEEP